MQQHSVAPRRGTRCLVCVAGLIGLLVLPGCETADRGNPDVPAAGDRQGRLSGNVIYRERMALSPDSEIRVRLEDVSRADAPATVLAETSIVTARRQVPIPFELVFDPNEIEPRGRYVVRAEIRDAAGELLFTTTTTHAVLASGGTADQIDVLVQRVGSIGGGDNGGNDDDGAGDNLARTDWELGSLRPVGGIDEPIDGERLYSVEFAADGNLAGQAHCNRYFGRYETTPAGELSVERLGATLMACALPSRAGEFLRAMERATGYTVDGDRLRIAFGDGGELAFLRRRDELPGEPAPEVARTFVFDCEGDIRFTVRNGPGEVAVWAPDEIGGQYFVLGRTRSASGARHEDGDTVFWDRGATATFEVGGRRYADCRQNAAEAPWADAGRRGIVVRALGNEPGWVLEIGPGDRLDVMWTSAGSASA